MSTDALLLLFLVSTCVGGMRDLGVMEKVKDPPKSLPCPEPDVILPCFCSADADFHMDIDCSAIESEEQLEEVFTSNLPFLNFRLLSIYGNQNLEVLRNGSLGDATFQEIRILSGVLEEVEGGALSGSYPTAVSLSFNENNIVDKFPYEELPFFTSLQELHMSGNEVSVLPTLQSSSLQKVYFHLNPLTSVPATTFNSTPALYWIDISSGELSDIYPGTFSGLPALNTVLLKSNNLTQLQEEAVHFSSSTNGSVVSLSRNQISSVSVNAISGLSNGEVFLEDNQIKTFEETVWRPLLEDNNVLWIYNNPLICGCDIAWVVLNTTFLNLVSGGRATCSDGTLLTDLDPGMYEAIC